MSRSITVLKEFCRESVCCCRLGEIALCVCVEDEEETFKDVMELFIFAEEFEGDEFWLFDKFPDAVISESFFLTSEQKDLGIVVRLIND